MVSSLDLRALGLFSVSLSALFLCEGLLLRLGCDIVVIPLWVFMCEPLLFEFEGTAP